MRRALTSLAKGLGPVLRERQVVLFLHVASAHIHATILAHARRLGIRLLFIPAGLTRVLQPLDTHVFAQYKRTLREKWREVRAASATGEVGTREWLSMIASSIRQVLQGVRWKSAFQEAGVLEHQAHISPRVLQEMGGLERLPALCPGPPTQEEVALVFPKRFKANLMAYVNWKTLPVQGPAADPVCRVELQPGAPSEANPMAGSAAVKRRVLPATFRASQVSSISVGTPGEEKTSQGQPSLARRKLPWVLRSRTR